MGKLTSKDRKSMSRSKFALPSQRKFPMPDPEHARLAIGGATRSQRAGNISAATAARIKAKARAKLGK